MHIMQALMMLLKDKKTMVRKILFRAVLGVLALAALAGSAREQLLARSYAGK